MLGFLIQPQAQPRPKDLQRRLHRARQAGTGVYLREWFSHAEDAPDEDLEAHTSTPEALAAAVMAWCRDTVGTTRRPWGIADFDLALSTAGAAGSPDEEDAPRTLSLRRLAPSDLYPGDSFLAEVQRYLTERGPVSHLAVALFSWGDATYEALRA